MSSSWPNVAFAACARIAAVTGMFVAVPVLVTLSTSALTPVSNSSSMFAVKEAPPLATVSAVPPAASVAVSVPVGAWVPSVKYHSQPPHLYSVAVSTLAS